jgi:peptidyl-prolyl cis-trans isomerase A (cyclophilin A)
MMRIALLAALLSVAAPLAAQPDPDPASVPVVLETSEGSITVLLEVERAPVTAANFLRYVDERRLDGALFYRAMRLGEGSGLVQAGADHRRRLPPIAHEPTSATGLSHVDGAVSMARAGPGSADADFFIIVGDSMTGLDAGPASGGDQLGYAVFGRVVEGMDVIRRILAAPTSPSEGEGVMRGQMLAPRVAIRSARRAQ